MDRQAKEKIEDTTGTGSLAIPYESWSCYTGSKKITKQGMLMLWEHINGANIVNHWNTKKQFGEGTAAQVDGMLYGEP